MRATTTIGIGCLLLFGLGCEPATMGLADADGGTRPRRDAGVGEDGPDPSDDDDAATPPRDDDAGTSAPGVDAGNVTPPPRREDELRVGYFSSWSVYDRNFHVMDMPLEMLTHVNYAFVNIAGGECVLGDSYADVDRAYPGDTWDEGVLRGSFGQLRRAKEMHPHLRTLLSIGGWTWSRDFSDVALTDASRERFARSCVELAARYGFDGLDVDWEFPVSGGLDTNIRRPEDKANYVLLLQALRRELEARASRDGRAEPYLLTIAVGAGPEPIGNLDLPAMAAALDWINVMTYDFHGAWARTTGHNAPMVTVPGEPAGFAVTDAIDGYLEGGVPASKLVLGVPFYGRSWAGATAGLRGAATGAGPGSWESGVLEWKDIAARYLTDARFTQGFDEVAQAPYLHDAAGGVFVSYDDPRSLAIKRDFGRSRGLAGFMIWEMNSDDSAHSLMRVFME